MVPIPEPAVYAILLSLLAGLCTAIGASVTLLVRKPGKKAIGITMGFASGVMLVVAFLNLTQKSIEISGYTAAAFGFMAGALFILLIDRLLPHIYPFEEKGAFEPKLYKTGVLTAIGIAIHNIPEGLVIGAGYMYLPAFGVLVAIAIAFHNIPEGMIVGIPLQAAGVKRKKAFAISCLSGMMEPIGAIVGVLMLSILPSLVPLAMAFAGGVMVYLTVDELIPTSHHYGHEHSIALGLILGLSFALFLSAVFRT